MEVAVLNINGNETGRKVNLSDAVFAIEPNNHAVYLDVKRTQNNDRRGTSSSKTRNAISGSTRKLKKQKGTGTARAGSIKSPVFRGGGRIFGPEPRDYTTKLNKGVKRLARKSALSIKAGEGAVKVLEDFSFDAIKTKNFATLLQNLGADADRSLFVLATENKNVYLSSRNIKNTNVITSSELSTYEILKAKNVFVLENAVEGIESNLSK